MKTPLKIAVLVSGSGSNLQALIDKQLDGQLNIQIVGVISNNADAYALTRATNANIPTAIIDRDDNDKKYKRTEFEQRALDILSQWQADLVVLAGFMRILTPLFIDGVNDGLKIPMINLHPSLLPNYKGLDTHARVLKSGEKYHGCSVHLVISELDAGQVLTQAVLEVGSCDTPKSLQEHVHSLEHQLLPWTVGLIADGLLPQMLSKSIVPLPWRLQMN